MERERTLVLIKPDAVKRELAGEIIARLERKGLEIVVAESLRFNADLARHHYAAHVDKPFFAELSLFMQSGPSIAMIVEGYKAIQVVRAMVGVTDGSTAAPGTIRGDFASGDPVRENLVHASDSAEATAREIELFFGHRNYSSECRVCADQS